MKKDVTLGKPVKRTNVKKVEYEAPVKLGQQGPVVLYLSTQLQKAGSSLKLTDKFHIGMRSAVISFQKKNGLKPTGVVDKKTWTKLTAK